jgi:hypothetical protein
VKVGLPNGSDGQLKSGLYGKARFVTGQRKVMAVPQVAIVQQGQLTGVFVVDSSGVARLRLIKTGKSFGERVEVLSGLAEGEQIVSDNVARIRDGLTVREPSASKQRVSLR